MSDSWFHSFSPPSLWFVSHSSPHSLTCSWPEKKEIIPFRVNVWMNEKVCIPWFFLFLFYPDQYNYHLSAWINQKYNFIISFTSFTHTNRSFWNNQHDKHQDVADSTSHGNIMSHYNWCSTIGRNQRKEVCGGFRWSAITITTTSTTTRCLGWSSRTVSHFQFQLPFLFHYFKCHAFR